LDYELPQVKILHVVASKKSFVDALLRENDRENNENGHRVLHIWPARIAIAEKGTESEPYAVKLHFIQSGNLISNTIVATNQISMFQVNDLFDMDWIENEGGVGNSIQKVRSDAETEWLEDHKIDMDDDEAVEDARETFADEIKKYGDEWAEQLADFETELAFSSLRGELRDEAQGIVYLIHWEEDVAASSQKVDTTITIRQDQKEYLLSHPGVNLSGQVREWMDSENMNGKARR